MNNLRRKMIEMLIDRSDELRNYMDVLDIGTKKAEEKVNTFSSDVEDILSEEEEYRDNIPENLQGGDRYQTAEDACDNLQEGLDEIEEVEDKLEEIEELVSSIQDSLQTIKEKLENAKE